MKELSKEQVVRLFDALLCDGLDNSSVCIIFSEDGENSAALFGYGSVTLEKGSYLLVYRSLDDISVFLDKFLEQPGCVFERIPGDDNDYVLLFRLTND